MTPKKPFLLRLDQALYDRLARWAADELRSVNGQIEYLLREAIKKRDRGDGRPRTGEEGH